MGAMQNPGALAGATGAYEASFAVGHHDTETGDAAQRLARATRLAGALGALVSAMPLTQSRALVRGFLNAVDDARRAEGRDALGFADAPTRAELRASWQALEPAQDAASRARRDFARLWNALTDADRAAFIRRVTARRR